MSRFSKGRFLPGISCLQSDTLLAYRYQFASSLKTCLPISCRCCRIWSFWFVLITLLMAVFLDTWEIGWSAVDPTQKGLHFTNPGWWGVFGNDFPNIWFVCKAFSGWNLKITFFGKENHLIPKPSYSKPPSLMVPCEFSANSLQHLRWKRFLCGHQLNWKAYQDSSSAFDGLSLSPEHLRGKQPALIERSCGQKGVYMPNIRISY